MFETHRRVLQVVAATQCKRCNRYISVICIACDYCEKCHLDNLIEGKERAQKNYDMIVIIPLVITAKLYINNHYLFQIKTFKTRKQAIAFVKRLKRSLYA